MNFDSIIKSRKSVREFGSKKPDWRDILECIDLARYAPTAGKNFDMKFILVDDKEKIQKIALAAEQDFIANAHFVVVAYSGHKRLVNLFGERGKVYSWQQSGAAIQNFLLAITGRGLSACWVGHFDEAQVKDFLRIPEDMEVEAVIPVGYEFKFSKAKPKEKIELDNILYFNEHKKKKMRAPYSPET